MTTSDILTASRRSILAPHISQLKTSLKGRMIQPGDEEYDKARRVAYAGIDRQPALIVRVADVQDVQRVIALARESGLELAVRSGGHSAAGHGTTEGGILLDLGDMRQVHIDPGQRTAWAETGLTAGEFTSAAGIHGLATGFGDTGSVGIGGITLGGGIGFLVRKYGLTIDSLLGAEIVTAAGEVLHVDAENHPDLFWALRGGGGNFGVVTRFQFRLHPVDPFVGGMLFQPATPETIAAFISEAEAAPEELSTIANVMTAPPMPFLPKEVHGKLIIMSFMAYTGEVEQGQAVIDRFRKLATPYADMTRPMAYAEMYPKEEGSAKPVLAAARTLFMDSADIKTAERMVVYLQESDADMAVAQLRVLGGAMSRVPVDATAFGHRASRIMTNVAAVYSRPEDKDRYEAWVNEFGLAMRQSDLGSYVNFIGEEGPERLRAAYPEKTWDRLAAVKRQYDPDNLFRVNHNIPPSV